MDLSPHLSPTSYMEGQAGRGGEASQGVTSPSRILALWVPAQGSPHLEDPKIRWVVPLRLCQEPEVRTLLGFSHICFCDGDREERSLKIVPGTRIFQQLPCLIPRCSQWKCVRRNILKMQATGSGAGWEGDRKEHWQEQNPVRWGWLCTPAHRRRAAQ